MEAPDEIVPALFDKANDLVDVVLPLLDPPAVAAFASSSTFCLAAVLRYYRGPEGRSLLWRGAWPEPLRVVKGVFAWKRALAHPSWLLPDAASRTPLYRSVAEEVRVNIEPSEVVCDTGRAPTWRIEVEWRIGHSIGQTNGVARLVAHVDATDIAFGVSHRSRIPKAHRVLAHGLDNLLAPGALPTLAGLARLVWAPVFASAAMAMVETRDDGSILVKAVPRAADVHASWPELRLIPDEGMRATWWLNRRSVEAVR